LLADFIIHSSDKTNFQRARQLQLKDFEDAVVASVAEASGSDYIVTRNVPDFAGSPVPAMTPTEFLEALAEIETK
jgi:nucleoside phosphorylase